MPNFGSSVVNILNLPIPVCQALGRSMVYVGIDEEEAREFADGWVDRMIKG
jgi:hypothetical protein